MTIESKNSETGANGHDEKSVTPAVFAPANTAKPGLSREFTNVLADIEYLIKDVAQLTGDDLTRTSEKINAHIAAARKTVEAMSDMLTVQANKTATVTSDYVQRQPWAAIGIGTVAGIVLGVLLARRA